MRLSLLALASLLLVASCGGGGSGAQPSTDVVADATLPDAAVDVPSASDVPPSPDLAAPDVPVVSDVSDVPDVPVGPDLPSVPDLAASDVPSVDDASSFPDAPAPDAAEDAGGPDVTVPAPRPVLNEVECRDREWVELANLDERAADLTGWALRVGETSYAIPPDRATLPARGYLVLERQTPSEDGFTFGVDCDGAVVELVAPDGAVADTVTVTRVASAFTWGRVPDAEGAWQIAMPTKGAPNAAPVDLSDLLYDRSRVIEIELELDGPSMDQLAAAPYEYAPGRFRIVAPDELATETLEVGIRLKGRAGSFRDLWGKSAFRVSLDHEVDDQRVLGLSRLVLNNMVQDPSFQHEWVAYRIFEAFGVPVPRSGYAWVRVNGEDFGLYLNLEDYDDVFLGRHFPSTQHLYEGSYGADVSLGSRLEVDEGDEADFTDLDALAEAAASPDEEWLTAMRGVSDFDEMMREWVVEEFIGHWDGYFPTINNYFLHSDDDGVFSMLPWGTDQTFDAHMPFMEGYSLLANRCRAIPECQAAFAEQTLALADLVESLALADAIDDQYDVLASAIAADPRREVSAEDVPAYVDAMKAFLSGRPGEMRAQLACFLDHTDTDGDGADCLADCDDGDPTRYPGAQDVCGDGVDQDCSGIADDAPDCPDCHPVTADGRYLLCAVPRGFDAAEEHCRALGEGGHLIVLESLEEEERLRAVWPEFEWMNCWVGVTDQQEEGVWRTTAGELATWLPWVEGEPNNCCGGENCAERWGAAQWNDGECSGAKTVVCELPCRDAPLDEDGDGVVSAKTCGTDCDDDDRSVHPGATDVCGNEVDEDCNGRVDDGPGCPAPCAAESHWGRRYAFCATGWLTAPAAEAACNVRGMHLVVPGSAEEQRWLNERADMNFGGYGQAVFWLGVGDDAEEGLYVDATGAPVTYTQWGGVAPDDPGSFEDCVVWAPWSGGWSDVWCGETHQHVCEEPCTTPDGDGDGFDGCGGDCDDTAPTVYPGATEVCGDGVDQSCDGQADEGCR